MFQHSKTTLRVVGRDVAITNNTLSSRTVLWHYSFEGCNYISQSHYHGCNRAKPRRPHRSELFRGESWEHRGIIILHREQVENVLHGLYVEIRMTRRWLTGYFFSYYIAWKVHPSYALLHRRPKTQRHFLFYRPS